MSSGVLRRQAEFGGRPGQTVRPTRVRHAARRDVGLHARGHRTRLPGLLARQPVKHVRVRDAGTSRSTGRLRDATRTSPKQQLVLSRENKTDKTPFLLFFQPVTDDPRGILRESRAVARDAESRDSQPTARRPVLSSFATSRVADTEDTISETATTEDELSEPRDPDGIDSEQDSLLPTETTRPASRPRGAFQALLDTRSFLENRREAMSSLDSPALGLAKPSAEDQETLTRVLPDGPQMSCEWRLDDHEVVVVVGCTPPPAKYFGLTPYVYRDYSAGVVRTLFASLGDTLSVGGDGVGNNGKAKFSRLSTSAGKVDNNADGSQGVLEDVNCWNSTFVTVFGKSRTTVDQVEQLLVDSNLIPGDDNDGVTMNPYGLSRQSGIKTHALLLRHAVPVDEQEWNEYATTPPFIVLRLTPRDIPFLVSPFPRSTLIRRQTFDERPLASSVSLLANRVNAFFRSGAFEVIEGVTSDAVDDNIPTTWASVPGTYRTSTQTTNSQVVFDNGQSCIDTSWNCGGDNRDTTYITGPTFKLPDDQTVAYVIGANHAATGNSVYANVAVYDPSRKLGIVAIDDSDFEGTANAWAEGTAAANDADKLFVVALARRCPGVSDADRANIDGFNKNARRGRLLDGTLCVEVPSSGFPSASLSSDLVLWERPYCHVETSVGPWWNRLALPTVVLATRTGDAVDPVGPGGNFGTF